MTTVDHFLDGFFRPTTLAVVGATDNPFKINYRLLRNLVDMGFQGKIFPVNPSVKEINGLKAFPKIERHSGHNRSGGQRGTFRKHARSGEGVC